jgi:hypothetical protein
MRWQVYYFTQTQFFDLSVYNQLLTFLGMSVASYAFSTFTYVMVELPFEGLFKLLLA